MATKEEEEEEEEEEEAGCTTAVLVAARWSSAFPQVGCAVPHVAARWGVRLFSAGVSTAFPQQEEEEEKDAPRRRPSTSAGLARDWPPRRQRVVAVIGEVQRIGEGSRGR
jgi:hypothetical protein